MDSLFDDYELSSEDKAQLKRDNRTHDRTSHASLRTYAKALRSAGTSVSADEVQEALTWLNMHQGELPAELENEAGQSGGKGMVISVDIGDNYTLDDDATKYEEHGVYYVAECTAYVSLESILLDPTYPEGVEAYKAWGMTDALYTEAMTVRGERYARHLAEQRKKARWLGMQEWDAVAKGDEYLRAGGAKLSVGAESAIDLPPVERLQQLFTVANGQLVWAVSRGRVAKGSPVTSERVRVDGTLYTSKRIHYKLVHGEDPKSAAVADDLTARDYRSVGASYESERKTVDNRFEATARIKGKLIKVGTYSTQEKADAASVIFLRSVERGL